MVIINRYYKGPSDLFFEDQEVVKVVDVDLDKNKVYVKNKLNRIGWYPMGWFNLHMDILPLGYNTPLYQLLNGETDA